MFVFPQFVYFSPLFFFIFFYFFPLYLVTTLKMRCSSVKAAAAAKSLQSCLTLCDPIDGSPPGFPVPGILQARTLEWVAISFSNAWKWKGKVNHSVVSDPQWPHGLQPTRLLRPWDFPGRSTGVGCHNNHFELLITDYSQMYLKCTC